MILYCLILFSSLQKEYERKVELGEFKPIDCKDTLSMPLETKEHPLCVRGASFEVTMLQRFNEKSQENQSKVKNIMIMKNNNKLMKTYN